MLKKMAEARTSFHTYREIFRTSGVRADGFSLPRQHSIDHYIQHIQNFGAPNGLCSSITEAKHIKAVKEPWRRSNRYEALGQMVLTNQRLEKLAYARADFSARGMLSGTCLSEALAALVFAQTPADNHAPLPPALLSDEDLFEDDPYVDPPDDPLDDPLDNPLDDDNDDDDEDGDDDDDKQRSIGGADVDADAQHLGDGVIAGPRVSGFVVLARKPREFFFVHWLDPLLTH